MQILPTTLRLQKELTPQLKAVYIQIHRRVDRKIAVSILVGVKTICSAKRDLAGAVGLHFAQG